MQTIILIGASGFVGSAILKEALDRGHHVKGIVRHPERINLAHPRLVVRKADVSSPEITGELCKGADAVISAYNPGWMNPDIASETMKTYPAILEGVKRAGIGRFLVVGGAGTLYVSPGLRLMDSGAIPDDWLPAVRALGSFYLDILSNEKEVDWVFFSPAGTIAPGERTGQFRLGKDDLVRDADGNSRISVEDYAVAMIDELENPAHHQERFTIGY